MNKEDILQAFRLTAMGRANTPLQDELAEKLAKVFAAQPQAAPMDDCGVLVVPSIADGSVTPTETPLMKRSPGRPKKAE